MWRVLLQPSVLLSQPSLSRSGTGASGHLLLQHHHQVGGLQDQVREGESMFVTQVRECFCLFLSRLILVDFVLSVADNGCLSNLFTVIGQGMAGQKVYCGGSKGVEGKIIFSQS